MKKKSAKSKCLQLPRKISTIKRKLKYVFYSHIQYYLYYFIIPFFLLQHLLHFFCLLVTI